MAKRKETAQMGKCQIHHKKVVAVVNGKVK
jgi:hypothetical protein